MAPRLADLLSILYRPRETMRRILDSGPDRWAIQIVLLAFVCASVSDIDPRKLSAALPSVKLPFVLAIAVLSIVVGAAVWVCALFLFSWIAAPVGRMMGGVGTAPDVRAALAWGMVPAIWSVLYRIPLAVYKNRFPVPTEANVRETLMQFLAHGGCSLIVVLIACQIALGIWSIYIASSTLGEAHRFSTGQGFVNLIIAVALPVLVIGAAVFTFAK
jgi:hypothetical protein